AGQGGDGGGDVAGDGVAQRAAGDCEIYLNPDVAVGGDVDALDHAQIGDRPPDLGVIDPRQRRGHLLGAGRRGGCCRAHGFMVCRPGSSSRRWGEDRGGSVARGASRKTAPERAQRRAGEVSVSASTALSRPATSGPMTSSHSPEPGSTRLTAAVQVTGPPPGPPATMMVARPGPASPGSGCSPGPVTT